jgi:hypothetical protein
LCGLQAVRVLRRLSCLAATLAVANSTQPSANQVIAHYVDIGDQGQSRLLAADGAGNFDRGSSGFHSPAAPVDE